MITFDEMEIEVEWVEGEILSINGIWVENFTEQFVDKVYNLFQ